AEEASLSHRVSLQQFFDAGSVVSRRLAGGAGADVGGWLAAGGLKRARKRLHGAGAGEHHFVGLINPMRRLDEVPTRGRAQVSRDDEPARFLERKVQGQ